MTILKQRNNSEPYAISEEIAHLNESLTVKIARLQKVNGHLMRKMQLQPEVRQALSVSAAAELLAMWHLLGYKTGKRAALSLGMSNYTWWHARAFCRLGLVHDGRNFTTSDPDEVASGLRVAAERLAKNPEALNRYLPASRRVRGGVRRGVRGGVS
jgi:hypothetical protein